MERLLCPLCGGVGPAGKLELGATEATIGAATDEGAGATIGCGGIAGGPVVKSSNEELLCWSSKEGMTVDMFGIIGAAVFDINGGIETGGCCVGITAHCIGCIAGIFVTGI